MTYYWYHTPVTCHAPQCAQIFRDATGRKKYCNGTCRQAAHRVKTRRARQIQSVENALSVARSNVRLLEDKLQTLLAEGTTF